MRQDIEFKILLIIFGFGNFLNLFAIIWFGSPWYEIFTSIFYVAAFTLVVYAVLLVGRIIWFFIKYRKGHRGRQHPQGRFISDDYIRP